MGKSRTEQQGNKATIALIVAQVALFVSSKWFDLDFGQGWTVLIAFGSVLLFAVSVAIGAVWLWWKGSRPQFGLLCLGLFLVAVGIPLGWLMSDVRTAQRHADIRRSIAKKFVEAEAVSRWVGPRFPLDPMPPAEWKQDFFADRYHVHIPNPSGDCSEFILMLPRVRRLSIRGIDLTDEHKQLVRSLPDLRALHLNIDLLKDSNLESFEALDQLEEIGVRGYEVTDASLSSIVKLKRLHFISIDSGGLTASGLSRLKDLPRLTELSLCDAELSDEEVIALQQTSIRHLSLLNARFSPKGFLLLASVRNLKSLSVEGSGIEDEHVQAISTLKRLESLDLSENMLTDRCLEYVARLPKLKKLFLFEEAITAEGIDAFRALRPDCEVEQ
jgi:hypothetical protein